MNNSKILMTAVVFSFLSALCILVAVPVAAGLKGIGGPGPIAFGNGAVLAQLAEAAPRAVLVDTLAFLGPILALPIGVGWYLLLKEQGMLAGFGVLLWYLGMIFVITQDAMQLALVVKLPPAYVAADAVIKPALTSFGESLAYVIQMLSFAAIVNYAGLLIVSMVMLRAPNVPKWIAILGITASLVTILSLVGSVIAPSVGSFRAGVAVGIIIAILVWIPAVGMVMWRRRNAESSASAA